MRAVVGVCILALYSKKSLNQKNRPFLVIKKYAANQALGVELL